MRYQIKHEVPGRIRFDLFGKISEHNAIALEETFLSLPYVTKCVAYPKAGGLAIKFNATSTESLDVIRENVITRLTMLSIEDVEDWEPADSLALAPRPRQLFMQLAMMVFWRLSRKIVLPIPLRSIFTFFQAIPFWGAALRSLKSRRLDVPVLDGAAISMGFMQGKPATSGSTIFLLKAGEILEDYTQKASETSLVRSLLDIPSTAHLINGNTEIEVGVEDLHQGDTIVVRLGDPIPVDGTVVRGEAAVNQSSLTGEPLAVVRKTGDTVYAGTTIEDGEIFVNVMGDPSESKIRSIVTMVEQSETLKSADQRRIEHMADNLVPWNFLLAGAVALTTRDINKTAAALMVDYSCALRLSGSVAVMAAQNEGAKRGFTVKGSQCFDNMADADCIIFDKTGTLTAAAPAVSDIAVYNGANRTEVLRLAACLEEHFPHPVARAVVNKAFEEGLEHRERHAAVEYIVAHGIVSAIDNKRVVIGSEHFVIEDEHVPLPSEELTAIHEKAQGASPLFMAIDGKLAAVIYIEDPLKDNVAEVIHDLRAEGFKRIIMLTGDSHRTAGRVAELAGIDEYQADLLPEDKHRIVQELTNQGYKVAMVGDGVNDSPALAAAHVSIAMRAGSAIAREAADIALVSDDLNSLLELRRLSVILKKRMKQGYTFTIAFNTALLALGIGGIISPGLSSALHNGSTVGLSAYNARQFLQTPPVLGLRPSSMA